MWVRMRHFISGGRADGRLWPPAHGEIEVPDAEGLDLVHAEVADRIRAPEPERAPEPGPLVTAAVVEAVPVARAPEPEPGPSAPEPPSFKDSKSAWVDYAVGLGADGDAASRMTKEQLQQEYGGRL